MSSGHGFDVLDVHHHVGDPSAVLGDARAGNPPAAGSAGGGVALADEVARRIEIMDAAGVRQAVVIPGHGYLRPNGHADTRRQNDGIAAYRDARPERFPAAVGVVEPRDGDELTAEELRRCREELGLAGISLHARFQGGGLDSPWVWRTVGAMGELGLVPFVHALDESTDEALWKVGQLAHKVPGVTILVLDAFATFEGTKHAGHLAEMHPNLVFDTSLSYNADFLVGYVRRFGAHRFAFGTDLYSWPLGRRISHLLDQIAESGLTDEQKAAVLGGTARRLLGLSPQPARDW